MIKYGIVGIVSLLVGFFIGYLMMPGMNGEMGGNDGLSMTDEEMPMGNEEVMAPPVAGFSEGEEILFLHNRSFR